MIIHIHCAKKRGFAPVAWAIMAAENLPFSHVAIHVMKPADEGYKSINDVFEAVMPLSRSIKFSRWDADYEIVETFKFAVPKEREKKIMSWLLNETGKPYSQVGIVIIMMCMLDKVFGRFAESVRWDGNKSLICSELVARFLRKFLYVSFGEKFDTISLRDVYSVLGKQQKDQYGYIWLP